MTRAPASCRPETAKLPQCSLGARFAMLSLIGIGLVAENGASRSCNSTRLMTRSNRPKLACSPLQHGQTVKFLEHLGFMRDPTVDFFGFFLFCHGPAFSFLEMPRISTRSDCQFSYRSCFGSLSHRQLLPSVRCFCTVEPSAWLQFVVVQHGPTVTVLLAPRFSARLGRQLARAPSFSTRLDRRISSIY
jgi:hypothetical protein